MPAQRMGNRFFSFESAFFSDPKVKIVNARYGSDGVLLYIYLMCAIFQDGYYLQIDDDFAYIIESDLHMDQTKIGQVLNFLLSRSLFDNTLFQSDKILTSHDIQTRYQMSVKSRAVKTPITVDQRIWLLSEAETGSFIKVQPCNDFSEKNAEQSDCFSRKMHERDAAFSEKMDHKRKEKKRKENNRALPQTPKPQIAEIKQLYQKLCPHLYPLSDSPSPKRDKAIAELLEHWNTEDCAQIFKRAEASRFLRGEGRSHWKAGFDWLIRPDNIAKLLEGQYDDGEPAGEQSYDMEELEEYWKNNVPTL